MCASRCRRPGRSLSEHHRSARRRRVPLASGMSPRGRGGEPRDRSWAWTRDDIGPDSQETVLNVSGTGAIPNTGRTGLPAFLLNPHLFSRPRHAAPADANSPGLDRPLTTTGLAPVVKALCLMRRQVANSKRRCGVNGAADRPLASHDRTRGVPRASARQSQAPEPPPGALQAARRAHAEARPD